MDTAPGDPRHPPAPFRVDRLTEAPIISADLDPSIGTNINGPSLIRVPDWLPDPLGRYYLYFAHHRGTFIRLAVADELAGPWRIHGPGTLQLEDTSFIEHIASPDVHVDHDRRQIRMYFHGLMRREGHAQGTRVALSDDGLSFTELPDLLGALPYFRVFRWDGTYYAWAMPGTLYRSADPEGLTSYEVHPVMAEGLAAVEAGDIPRAMEVLDRLPFPARARHAALLLEGAELTVFFTRWEDEPERILCSTIPLQGPWTDWTGTDPLEVLEPETPAEGGDLGVERSKRGAIDRRTRQLRDPAIHREGDRTWLLYAVAGESGIAIAELHRTG